MGPWHFFSKWKTSLLPHSHNTQRNAAHSTWWNSFKKYKVIFHLSHSNLTKTVNSSDCIRNSASSNDYMREHKTGDGKHVFSCLIFVSSYFCWLSIKLCVKQGRRQLCLYSWSFYLLSLLSLRLYFIAHNFSQEHFSYLQVYDIFLLS